jgi:hypothetical protein
MTIAVCVKCGSMKFGAYTRCQACNQYPETDDERLYSLVFTDHYLTVEKLKEISQSMLDGAPRPSLPPHQEEKFRQSFAHPSAPASTDEERS